MKIYFADQHEVVLPSGHRFPMHKYRMIRDTLRDARIVSFAKIHPAPRVKAHLIKAVHDPDYVDAFFNNTLSKAMIRRIGFPWSPSLLQRVRASVGGTLAAADGALKDGVGGNLAGGTHHASTSSGGGFCVFNDVAVAFQNLKTAGQIDRASVIDLDVHQGDGTAEILGPNPDVFTLSVHSARNYPFTKIPGSLDVGLPDGCDDASYLDQLKPALDAAFAHKPDIVFYQAGVDPLHEDSLGRLSLSFEGLMARDREVLTRCRDLNIPVALTIGGGYAKPIALTVQANVNTYRVVQEVFGQVSAATC